MHVRKRAISKHEVLHHMPVLQDHHHWSMQTDLACLVFFAARALGSFLSGRLPGPLVDLDTLKATIRWQMVCLAADKVDVQVVCFISEVIDARIMLKVDQRLATSEMFFLVNLYMAL